MPRPALALAVLLALAPEAAAQDRAGRDTPGEWQATHYRPFGLWDSICDKRVTGDLTEERCYLRYVEVFSPRPDFAAQFAFVTPEGAGERVEFGTERGTRFEPGGFRVERGGTVTWQTERDGCLNGSACIFVREDAQALLEAMAAGGAFRFTFTDRHGAAQDLAWDLSQFAAALADFRAEAAAHGLR